MIGVVMAGGKSSRISTDLKLSQIKLFSNKDCTEKLMLSFSGKSAKPLIAHVIDALVNSKCMDKIFVITSQTNSPQTRKWLQEMYRDDNTIVKIMDSKGAGYSKDLQYSLCKISHQYGTETKAFVVSGDMPFLDSNVIRCICDHYAKNMWTSIVVSKIYAKKWDSSFEYMVVVDDYIKCYYTGISLVDLGHVNDAFDMPQRHVIFDDHRIAISINTINDYTTFLAGLGKPT